MYDIQHCVQHMDMIIMMNWDNICDKRGAETLIITTEPINNSKFSTIIYS